MSYVSRTSSILLCTCIVVLTLSRDTITSCMTFTLIDSLNKRSCAYETPQGGVMNPAAANALVLLVALTLHTLSG